MTKSQAEQGMGDLGNKHVQDSFIRMVYEMKGMSTSFLHHILLARLVTAGVAMSNLFPSSRHQSFNQYKCKEFSKKKFEVIPTEVKLAN